MDPQFVEKRREQLRECWRMVNAALTEEWATDTCAEIGSKVEVPYQTIESLFTNLAWKRIDSALHDRRYDFRTVEGLARNTGLTPRVVGRVLTQKGKEENTWRSPVVRDDLYTSADRPKKIREILSEMRHYAALRPF